MALRTLAEEIRADEKIGDTALEMFEYDVQDIYSREGQLKGTIHVVPIELTAMLRSRISKILGPYLKKISNAKNGALAELKNLYEPRMQEIVSELEKKEVEMKAKRLEVPKRQKEVEESFKPRLERVEQYIKRQERLVAKAEINLAKEIAKVGLKPEEEMYITELEAEIKEHIAERQAEAAESGNYITTLKNAANYLHDPISISLLEKLNSKRDISRKYTQQINKIRALIKSYNKEKEGVLNEMKRQTESISLEVESFLNKTRAEMIRLEKEHIELETEYDIKRREIISTALNIEKDVRDRIRIYYRKKQAESYVKKLIKEEEKRLKEQLKQAKQKIKNENNHQTN